MRADTYFTWTALGVFTMGVSATPVLASVYLPEDALCGLEYDRVNQANGNRPPTMFEPKNSEDQALRCSTENSRDPRKALAIPFLLNDDSSSATDLVNDDAGSSPDAKPFEATAPPSLSETAPASDELEEEMSRVSSAAIPPEVMTPVFSKGFQSLRDVLLFWSPGDILEAIPHQAKRKYHRLNNYDQKLKSNSNGPGARIKATVVYATVIEQKIRSKALLLAYYQTSMEANVPSLRVLHNPAYHGKTVYKTVLHELSGAVVHMADYSLDVAGFMNLVLDLYYLHHQTKNNARGKTLQHGQWAAGVVLVRHMVLINSFAPLTLHELVDKCVELFPRQQDCAMSTDQIAFASSINGAN